MKKQLLVFSLAGLFALTACGQQKPTSRELKPVDDATGLQRATKILEAETTALSAAQEDHKKIFDILPKTFTFNAKRVMNGKAKLLDMSSEALFIVERIFDNFVETESIFESNYDTLQLHSYSLRWNKSTKAWILRDYNFFYDEPNKTAYLLTNEDGVKTKMSVEATNREVAENYFFQALGELGSGTLQIVLPTEYLTKITTKNEDDKYVLLEAFNGIQKDYFDRFANDDEYFKYQFGSDDESSLSIKNDLKISLNYIPMISEQSSFLSIVGNGYATGDNASTYNPYIKNYFDNELLFGNAGSAPDLIVFKNNFLSYFTSTETVDVVSTEQLGVPAGALYQHTKRETTIETAEKAEIVNPNPDDYKEED